METLNLSLEELNELSNNSKEKFILWKKSKKEFCDYVNDEYANNDQKYSNRKDAVNKMFSIYSFKDKQWTAKKCYDLCLQLLRK